jgi:TonB-dependent starch-binding outer membrane protein SusC
MRKIKIIKAIGLAAFLSLFTLLHANAQENTSVSGKVLDAKTKTPLEGASIQIQGSTNTVTTNSKGEFKLTTYKKLPFSVFVSFVGYVTQEVPLIAPGGDIKVELIEAPNELGEVVVVGYGTQTRKSLIGSIAKADPSQTKDIPGGGFDQQIQGKTAGVQINANTGVPGEGVFIRVRGSSSIYAGNDPLYIIDGVFVSTATLEQSTSITAQGNNTSPIADINPADIESVEILKDASAVAIYGSRGANGVVIVTTKKGKYDQKPVIEFNTTQGESWVPLNRQWKTTTGPQHAMLINEYNTNMGTPIPFRPVDSIINGAAGLGVPDSQNTYNRMVYLDHQGAPLHSYNLSIRGGSKDTRYYVAGGYDYEAAIWNPITFSRASLKFNLDQKLNNRVSINTYNTLTVTPRNEANDGNGGNGTLLESSLNIPTYLPIFSPTGVPLKWVNFDNITYLTDHVNIHSLSLHYIGNVGISADLLPNLKFHSSFGADYDNFKESQYWGSNTDIGAPPINGYAQTSITQSATFVNEQTLTYTDKIAQHSFGILVGNTLQGSVLQNITASGTNFPNNSYTLISQAASQSATQSWTENKLASFFSRANYNYKEKYYLEATLRADGSSKFAPGHQWGYFPSIGGAWDIKEEDFLKDDKFISGLKLRTSYGITGNQGGIGDFAAQGLWTSGYGYADTTGGAQQPGTAPYQLPNPNLTWEQTAQTDFGVDVGILNNRINLGVDYYDKYTTNLLVQEQVPATTGFSTYYTNGGAISNKGFELEITSRNIDTKNFTWTTEFNTAQNINKIVQLSTPINNFDASRNLLIDKQGSSLYSYWLYKQLYVDPQTGAAIFQHADGTKGTAYTTSTNAANREVFNIAPKFFGGLTNTLTYKGFDLNIFFTYEDGNKVWNHNRMLGETGGTLGPTGRVLLASQLERWTTPGQVTDVPKLDAENYSIQQNSRFLEDGSFLRLRALTLGYTLPKSVAARVKVQSIRLSITANNLFIITKYTGADPETNDPSGNPNIQGYDYAIPPMPRTLQVGLKITL